MDASLANLAKPAFWLIVGTFCSTVATCGQKGPLELPEEDAAMAHAAAAVGETRVRSLATAVRPRRALRP